MQAFLHFFGLGSAIVLGVFCAIGFKLWAKAKRSLAWPFVVGEILHSSVEQEAEGPGRSSAFVPWVIYTYEVSGVAYSCSAITVCDSSFGYGWSQKVIQRYPEKSKVNVYYDPEKPSDALLEPGNLTGVIALFFFLGLYAAFLALMWFLARNPARHP